MQPSSISKLNKYLNAPPTDLDRTLNINEALAKCMATPFTEQEQAEAAAMAAEYENYSRIEFIINNVPRLVSGNSYTCAR
jgi:predicted RNase H-like nuclease (RuvC/YqgF family)